MAFKQEKIKESIGARVLEDKAALLSGEFAEELRALLEERGVLVFPEINFTEEEQVAFTKTLGNYIPETADGSTTMISLDEKKNPGTAEYLKGSLFWHLDGTMNAKPILASILCSKTLSPEGGDTHFANTYAAYEALSDEEKAEYAKYVVRHAPWASMFFYNQEPDINVLEGYMAVGETELPLVWKHESGRKSLVLGCTAYEVVGKSYKESKLILNRLLSHATSEDFVYKHKWSVGDMVIWDNTGTLHRATPYDPLSGRELRRTKLEGEEAFAFADAV